MQYRLGRDFEAVEPRDQRRKQRVQRVQPRRHLARLAQRQHRHRTVGFDLADALHDAPDTAFAGSGSDKDRKAHVTCRINPEIAGNYGRIVNDTGDGHAFTDEPVVEPCIQFGLGLRNDLDPDQQRHQALARRIGQPGLRKNLSLLRIERPGGNPLAKGRIGHKFGVAFPFQIVAPDGAGIMRRLGLGVRRAMPRQQAQQMRAVAGPVAVGGLDRLLDRNIGGMAGHGQRGKRPRVQLIHQVIAQGVIFDLGHCGAFKCLPANVTRSIAM